MEDKKQMKVVAALGHSALGYTTTEQRDAVRVTANAQQRPSGFDDS